MIITSNPTERKTNRKPRDPDGKFQKVNFDLKKNEKYEAEKARWYEEQMEKYGDILFY